MKRSYSVPFDISILDAKHPIIALDGAHWYNGAHLFELSATHGLPLCMALDKLGDMQIFWPAYIERARNNNRWDYQIYEDIEHGITDAEWPKKTIDDILDRVRLYCLKYPTPLREKENEAMQCN